jgi:hypothetical protein
MEQVRLQLSREPRALPKLVLKDRGQSIDGYEPEDFAFEKLRSPPAHFRSGRGLKSENYVGGMNSAAYSAFNRMAVGRMYDVSNDDYRRACRRHAGLVAACNTVRGAGEDVQSVANCTRT